MFSPQQRDGIAEIAVEKIMMRDKGRNRRIADHRGAEVVERETVVRQSAQKPERRRGFEEPSRGRNAQGHSRRERLAVLRTRPKKVEDLEFHAGAENLRVDEAGAEVEQRSGLALRQSPREGRVRRPALEPRVGDDAAAPVADPLHDRRSGKARRKSGHRDLRLQAAKR